GCAFASALPSRARPSTAQTSPLVRVFIDCSSRMLFRRQAKLYARNPDRRCGRAETGAATPDRAFLSPAFLSCASSTGISDTEHQVQAGFHCAPPSGAGASERQRGMKLIRPKSLKEMVADELRMRIIDGRLQLGAGLSENGLAAELGISKTPVREALLQLKQEGLVEVQPQRGTYVFRMAAEQVVMISELREIL